AAGRFRADLFYRLNVVGFYLPPLRERRAVIEPLTRRFVSEFSGGNGQGGPRLTKEALRALQEHNWPGNIRELKNAGEPAVSLYSGQEIQHRDLPPSLRSYPAVAATTCNDLTPIAASSALSPLRLSTLSAVKAETESARIVEVLHKHKNNRLRAA